jgi:hypothetical protein
MIGIRKFFTVIANIVVTSSVTPVTTGLSSPIAANQKQKLRFWVPFSVGATGGIRAILIIPAGATIATAMKLVNTVAPSITTAFQTSSTAFTNALANAGNHWLEVEVYVENSTTAGTVDLQVAQNSSDVLSLTILKGGSVDVVIQ